MRTRMSYNLSSKQRSLIFSSLLSLSHKFKRNDVENLVNIRGKVPEITNQHTDCFTVEELILINQQLKVINEDLQLFACTLSHDLRSPLTVIKGLTNLLKHQYENQLDEQGQKYLIKIDEMVNRIDRQIEGMLSLYHLTQTQIKLERINLTALVQEIISDLQNDHPQRCVRVKIEPNLSVLADPTLLPIAISNLLNNAWKYTSKSAEPEISVGMNYDESGQLVYYIKDNGVGFDLIDVDRLFQPFQRMHRETEFPGLGIGLASTQRIIKKHGGDIWVETAIDRGTTFYFTLNYAPNSVAREEAEITASMIADRIP